MIDRLMNAFPPAIATLYEYIFALYYFSIEQPAVLIHDVLDKTHVFEKGTISVNVIPTGNI